MKIIYLLVDDYTPDAGSTIYGAYTTLELAKKALEHLEDAENNEYGENLNEDDTIEVRSLTLKEE